MTPIRAELQLSCDKFLGAIRSVDGAVNTLKNQIGSFAATFAGLGIVAAGVGVQFQQMKQALDLGGELQDLSANTGQSVSDLVTLRQAFQNAGLGADGVAPALGALAKSLSGVNEDGEPTKDIFDKLNVSINALRDMPATAQLLTLGDAIAKLPNPVDRTKAAMDLFGKAGRKMAALLSDPQAFSAARAQVGALGDTLQTNVATFDSVSDAIGALHLKVEQFYTGMASQLAGGAAGPIKELSELDFTGFGESIGMFLGDIGKLVSIVWTLKPALAGVAAQMTATTIIARLGGNVLTTTIPSAIGKTVISLGMLRAQLATTGVSFSSLALTARTGFTGMVSAATAGARGVIAALGPIGIATAVATLGFTHIMDQAEKIRAANRAQLDLLKERQTSFTADVATVKNVSSEDERTKAAQDLADKLAEVKRRLADVDDDYEHLNDEGRARISDEFKNWIVTIEATQRSLAKIPLEVLRHRQAEKDRKEALEASKKQADELFKSLEKLKEEKEKAALQALPPEQQRNILLRGQMVGSTADLDRAIGIYEQNLKDRDVLGTDPQANVQLDYQQGRLAKMIEVRRQLLDVEKQITEQRQRQAKETADAQAKAAEEAKKRASTERSIQLEIAKLQAEGRGDTGEADRVDRISRYEQYRNQYADSGLGFMEADSLARQKVSAEDLANAARDRAKAESPESRTTVFADDDRRLGLGGVATAVRTDPLVRAQQESVRATQTLTKSIDNLAGKIGKPQPPVTVLAKPAFQ